MILQIMQVVQTMLQAMIMKGLILAIQKVVSQRVRVMVLEVNDHFLDDCGMGLKKKVQDLRMIR